MASEIVAISAKAATSHSTVASPRDRVKVEQTGFLMVAGMHGLCTHCRGLVDSQTYEFIDRSQHLQNPLQGDCLQGFGV